MTSTPVVLIHGYAGHRLLWWRFVRGLREASFSPRTWGYRSIWFSLETFARRLDQYLTRMENDPGVEGYHIVVHSMGAILLRTLIASRKTPLSKLQKIVMLCPPNQGSHAARRLARFAWFSPSLKQITDDQSSFVNRLPADVAIRWQVGLVVAKGDLVVAPDATRLKGVSDVCQVPGMHSAVLMRHDVVKQTVAFLRDGRFETDCRP